MNKRTPSKARKTTKVNTAPKPGSRQSTALKDLPRRNEDGALERIKGGGIKDHSV